MSRRDGPLLVFGPRSTTYDFGPGHPLTPRRFGPGIDLLRAVGAEPGLAPEPAADSDLLRVHGRRYVEIVKRFARDPFGPAEAGIGPGGDDPPFPGMHEAAASVASGSLLAMEALLRGDVEHALHPGGGLHHAMRDRAAGFCIYNDPALAIARAREAGLRVLYVDLDVHHGDGVEAIHAADPGVLTVSFHESGRYLFPGTGFVDEVGEGTAAATIVNVPLQPPTGETAWLEIVRQLVPELAASFGPDVVVSQHGADAHAWDPLAHLRVTTTAMGAAARLVDAVAHRHASGRWLATNGGGYDAYRVVPRAWALTWLAGAHRDVPSETPAGWRSAWTAEAERYGQAPLPATFDDAPNLGDPVEASQVAAEALSRATAVVARALAVPLVVRTAVDRGWWEPLGASPPTGDRSGRRVAPRVLPLADADDAAAILEAAEAADAAVVTEERDGQVVGAGIAVDGEIVALGVAPGHRRQGIGRSLLDRLVERSPGPLRATVTVAERDPVEPLDRDDRILIARSLLRGAGFRIERAPGDIGEADPGAIVGIRD